MPFSLRTVFLLAVVGIVAGCAAKRPAPVVERTIGTKQAAPAVAPARTATRNEGRSEFYTVKPGDTLFSIALEHGLDYRELAIWNGLDNPGAMKVGQELRLTAPAGAAVAAPLKVPSGNVEARPLGSGPAAAPLPPSTHGASGPMVSEPRGVRLPYSEQALAQLAKTETAPVRPDASRSDPRAENKADPANDAARSPEDLDWGWPVKGKVIGTFNESTNKGIAIAGKLGQPVLASAPGRVIFSGTGIRGFGKLVVIKHNNTYLSVYAHNSELTVKEGQMVTKGQKIAEMGNTDADQVKLHFEIRRFGKPVDPMKLLPASA